MLPQRSTSATSWHAHTGARATCLRRSRRLQPPRWNRVTFVFRRSVMSRTVRLSERSRRRALPERGGWSATWFTPTSLLSRGRASCTRGVGRGENTLQPFHRANAFQRASHASGRRSYQSSATMQTTAPPARRKALCTLGAIALAGVAKAKEGAAEHPDARWYEAAESMKRLAQTWGDQSYGAVLVLHGRIVGEGPSRVVRNNDMNAHAEREAIRDAQRNLGRASLAGAVLYSTSRACSLCEAAAAKAGVSRMYHGSELTDAGVPRVHPR